MSRPTSSPEYEYEYEHEKEQSPTPPMLRVLEPGTSMGNAAHHIGEAPRESGYIPAGIALGHFHDELGDGLVGAGSSWAAFG